jgi:hypothetical protein
MDVECRETDLSNGPSPSGSGVPLRAQVDEVGFAVGRVSRQETCH